MSRNRTGTGRAQRGAALIVLMAVIAVSAAWLFVNAVTDASRNLDARRRQESSEALKTAKYALLGYVASQALTDSTPGRLPCPEAPGYYGDPSQEGIAAPSCTLPAVGRLPWRTLGVDKLTDSYGEPLWYVVSEGFALPYPGATLRINSNTAAQLTLDGAIRAATALIIAPGPAFAVQAAAGCSARGQSRSSAPPDRRDYLECDNATTPADASFVSRGPSASFNDQVLAVTQSELFAAVDPVVARRIESEIVPQLKNMYASANRWWSYPGTVAYPFATPFSNPGTSNFRGQTYRYQGLLPATSSATDPGFVRWDTANSWGWWSWGGSVSSYSCNPYFTSTELRCQVTYTGSPVFGFYGRARNVANALRQWNPSAIIAAGNAGYYYYDGFVDYDGAAWIYAEVLMPNAATSTTRSVRLPIGFLGDHTLLDETNATTGWFVRNRWHQVTYYAVSPGYSPDGWGWCATPPDTPSCIRVTNAPSVDGNRAALAFAGRSLSGTARPNDQIGDFLEGTNAAGVGTDYIFETRTQTRTFNDRVSVIDP